MAASTRPEAGRGERLAGVGEALAQDPEAERAAEATGEHQLERRTQLDPAHRVVGVVVVLDRHRARAAALLEDDQLAPVGGLERGAVERLARRPERDLLAAQAEDAVEAACALDVVAGNEQRPALAAQRLEQLRRSAARWRGRLPPAARPTAARARPGRARAPAARAGAGRLTAPRTGLADSAASPTRSSAAAAAVAVGAARGQPPAPACQRAHQGHVQRGHREVESGAFGLRHVGRPPGEPDRPALPARARPSARGRGWSCRPRSGPARRRSVPVRRRT